MNRKYLAFSLILALCLLLLSGCSPSPTAVTVGGRKVDASEYAFYLSYNRISVGEASGTILYDEEDTAAAKAAAPEVMPTKTPSCSARKRATLYASSSCTVIISSITERSRFFGTKPAPIP